MPVQVAPDGYSQSPPQTGVDALDSHFLYVQGRLQQSFPQFPAIGVVDARDWPFQQAAEQSLYLVTGDVRNSRQVNSWQSSLATYKARWCWIVIGTDLTQGVQVANRGDKYRIAAAMRTALLTALYPGFCQKQQYAVVDNGLGQPIYAITTPYAFENVWWSKPDFASRQDLKTGIIFGYAAVAISAFEPEINS